MFLSLNNESSGHLIEPSNNLMLDDSPPGLYVSHCLDLKYHTGRYAFRRVDPTCINAQEN